MKTWFSRREFLKMGGLTIGTLAALPFRITPPWHDDQPYPFAIGRVTASAVSIRAQASSNAERLGYLHRDQLISLLEEIVTDKPIHNPRWYRFLQGFVHSGYIQRINLEIPNSVQTDIPAVGILAEVTAPYSRAYRHTRQGWQRLYRLYYSSLHWVTGVDEGPDGSPWYRIKDYMLDVNYCVDASDLRLIPPEVYSPIAAEIPPKEKRIEISISQQKLTAFQGEKTVFEAKIASGMPSPDDLEKDEIPTETPLGSFWIQNKMPSQHMGDGRLTDDSEAYELPGVPWTMIFQKDGVALHGTYWHDNFGIRMSHGCVNMRNQDALWLFRWTNPVFDPTSWYKRELGTLVVVKD